MLSILFLFFSSGFLQSQSQSKWSKQLVDEASEEVKELIFSNPDSAFIKADLLLKVSTDLDYSQGIAKSNFLLGLIFYHQGVYLESLDHLLEAESLFKELEDQKNLAESINQQGLVYYNIKQPEMALEKHLEAYGIYERIHDKSGLADALGAIGRQYEKRESYDQALKYNREALELYTELKDTTGIATILENIGSIYEDLEDYPFAMEYFRKSLNYNMAMQDSIFMIINLNNIGDIFRKTDQYDSAIYYTLEALNLAERLNEKYQLSSAYKDLSKIYAGLGEMDLAFHYLDSGRRLYEEIYSMETPRQLGIMQTLFEKERQNNQIMVLEQAKRANRFLNISLVAVLLLIIFIGLNIFNRQKLKINQNKRLHEAEKQIMKREIENKVLHEKQLEQEVNLKSKSLTAHTLHIIGKNQMLEEIKSKLKSSLDLEPSKMKKSVRSLIKQIEFNFSEDKDWDDFRQIFEQIHQTFFDELAKISSDLTPSEIRLAALIRINLPAKDMATILGISNDSLRTSRYRLKKKLKLGADESLSNFILSI